MLLYFLNSEGDCCLIAWNCRLKFERLLKPESSAISAMEASLLETKSLLAFSIRNSFKNVK